MSNSERPPKIISVSGGLGGPKIVSTPSERKLKVWAAVIGTPPGIDDALAFAARYRDFAGIPSETGFKRDTLERMAQASTAAPVRFIYEMRYRTETEGRGHWMLYLQTISPDMLRVYDPAEGVKDLTIRNDIHSTLDVMFNNPKAEAQWGPEKTSKSTFKTGEIAVTYPELLNPPAEAEYHLKEEALVKLGPTQKNAFDCGPLCVYAAAVARTTA